MLIKFKKNITQNCQFKQNYLNMREIVFIQVGQCGNQVGQKVSDENIEFPQNFIFFHFSSGKIFVMNMTSMNVDTFLAIQFFPFNDWMFILTVYLTVNMFLDVFSVIFIQNKSTYFVTVNLVEFSILTVL